MGIWDQISWAANSLKQNAPDLTQVQQAVNSATDSLKKNAPDLSPVNEAYRKIYDQADDTVRSEAKKCYLYLSDEQVRDNIARISTNAAKNAAVYCARSYGAGPVLDIVMPALHANRKADGEKGRIEMLEAEVGRMKTELNRTGKLLERAEILLQQQGIQHSSQSKPQLTGNQKPEDLIHIFMMEEFVGSKLFDDLIVPNVRSGKNVKPAPFLGKQDG
ncbi:hypothetical protein Ancab_035083 [Ancistrocladus abbreviatus]